MKTMMNLWKNRKLVNHIAKEIERDACKVYGWTPEQFEAFWTKPQKWPVDKAIHREQARAALKALKSFENKSS